MGRQCNGDGNGRCDSDAKATAIEGVTEMRRQQSDGDERRDRATTMAAMVGTMIAMAADGKTTIN